MDIPVLCADGLSGIKKAIEAAFPKTYYQRCIVHMVRNTPFYVSEKNKKSFAADLKTIHHAAAESTGFSNMLEVKEKWDKVYLNAMKRRNDNWDVNCPIFKFSMTVCRAFYTTNAIESLNSQYRSINTGRPVFPSEEALKKVFNLEYSSLRKNGR